MSERDDLRFASLFAIEEVETDVWSVPNPPVDRATVFGGQVAAQSIVAAARTVDGERPVHSLHAYFLRSGTPGAPMTVAVERTRDGRSFATRRVVATQEGSVVLNAAVSFHRVETSDVLSRPMPDVPAPEQCRQLPRIQLAESALEVRDVPATDADSPLGELRVWVRAREALPDLQVVHTAAMAFMSDTRTGSSVGIGVGGWDSERGFAMVSSLDHALWVHEALRADTWLLMSVETLAYARARGLVLGTFHTAEGIHVATFTQELVMRQRSG